MYVSLGSDGASLQAFINTICEISNFMSEVRRDKADRSYYHINGEQIRAGMCFLFPDLFKRFYKNYQKIIINNT